HRARQSRRQNDAGEHPAPSPDVAPDVTARPRPHRLLPPIDFGTARHGTRALSPVLLPRPPAFAPQQAVEHERRLRLIPNDTASFAAGQARSTREAPLQWAVFVTF